MKDKPSWRGQAQVRFPLIHLSKIRGLLENGVATALPAVPHTAGRDSLISRSGGRDAK